MIVAAYRATEAGIARKAEPARAAERRRKMLEELHRRWRAEELARIRQEEVARIRQEVRAAAIEAARRSLAPPPRRMWTYREIEAKACKAFGTKPSEIRSSRRNREIVLVRHFICYWTVRLTRLSMPQIGRLMGGRDHTTILHGRKAWVRKRKAMGRTLRAAR